MLKIMFMASQAVTRNMCSPCRRKPPICVCLFKRKGYIVWVVPSLLLSVHHFLARVLVHRGCLGAVTTHGFLIARLL